MKNAFVRLISRFDTAEERISDLKSMSIESTQIETQRKNENKTEQTTQEFWDYIKHCNICIIWILGEREKGVGRERERKKEEGEGEGEDKREGEGEEEEEREYLKR